MSVTFTDEVGPDKCGQIVIDQCSLPVSWSQGNFATGRCGAAAAAWYRVLGFTGRSATSLGSAVWARCGVHAWKGPAQGFEPITRDEAIVCDVMTT